MYAPSIVIVEFCQTNFIVNENPEKWVWIRLFLLRLYYCSKLYSTLLGKQSQLFYYIVRRYT